MSDMPLLEEKGRGKKGRVREYVEALGVALLLAFVIRSFVFEAFKIPSSSMVPTLLVGDHIFVNKFHYGWRIPFTKYWPVKFSELKRGDVVVFIWPVDESKDFIKRVIGLPGDTIRAVGHDLYVNGELLPHDDMAQPDTVIDTGYTYYRETVDGVTYTIRYDRDFSPPERTFQVPDNSFFVMGDNRDNSQDSREWGAVPRDSLKGQAMFVWLSRDYDEGGVRWKRFGTWIR